MRRVAALIVLLCAAAGGCRMVPAECVRTRMALGDLRMGASIDAIVAALGPPLRREDYRMSPDSNVSFLFYRTGPEQLAPDGEDLGLTPVAVGRQGLQGTSWNAYHAIRRSCPRADGGEVPAP